MCALVLGLMAIGCRPASPPAGPALSSESSVRLVKDKDFDKWSEIDVSPVGRATHHVPLASVEADCLPLVLAHDAQVVAKDLDGDGVDDLALWSPADRYLAFWKAWQRTPSAPPVVFAFRCSVVESSLELCRGYQVVDDEEAGSSPLVAIVRHDRLDQIVEDPDFSYGSELELVDVTFDGRPDLLVPIAPCSGNCWVNVWPYNPRSARFVASPSLTHLSNIEPIDARRRLLESRECGGEGCALFTARLLEVDERGARVIAEAIQDDATPGSVTKRLRVTSRVPGREGALTCEALVDPGGPVLQVQSGDCARWPLLHGRTR
ncbi:MAG: hypothetical protein HOV81_19690 [Kofleriaceae bacterium]|nr:hypothetical protein [Kofleriaceae bacterium]